MKGISSGTAEPLLVNSIRAGDGPFPVNPATSPSAITSRLHWASWGSVGDVLAAAYSAGVFSESESGFARDLLAYLSKKRLWENCLPDEAGFYSDKLYRSLQLNTSPFLPYAQQRPERYRDWRDKPWDEAGLTALLQSLRLEDKALLKVLADAGGTMRQDALMLALPMLRGKTSASLRALKSHVNAQCKQLDRAPLLSEGNGSGAARRHEINSMLGTLRDVVISVARSFEIDWRLLESAPVSPAELGFRPT